MGKRGNEGMGDIAGSGVSLKLELKGGAAADEVVGGVTAHPACEP